MLEAAQQGVRGALDFLVGGEREDGPGLGCPWLLQRPGARSLVAGVAGMYQDPLNGLCTQEKGTGFQGCL